MENRNNFLLDTHIFIWWMESSKRLSKSQLKLLNDPQNQIFISVASVWEIILKRARHKLKVPNDIESGITKSGFTLVPIKLAHVLAVEKLPNLHSDPFDRVLIAQALTENLVFITDDIKIKKYDLQIL